MEERYPYQVNAIMPIIGLSIGTIKVPCTQELTKEDVLICLKKAPVFRRFTNGIKERVGIDNIDRLHRENYMTKEEFEKISSNSAPEEVVKVEEPIKEVVEPEPEVIPDIVEEEPVAEEEQVEETVEEEEVSVPVPEVTPEEDTIVEEENSIDDDDDVVANELFEAIESDEIEYEDNFNNQNNNHHKNNRKKKHYN